MGNKKIRNIAKWLGSNGRWYTWRSFCTFSFKYRVSEQGKKYFLIWVGNLLLNARAVYFLIKIMGVQYLIAKMNTAIIVAIGYNYPSQKGYVFKTVDKKWTGLIRYQKASLFLLF